MREQDTYWDARLDVGVRCMGMDVLRLLCQRLLYKRPALLLCLLVCSILVVVSWSELVQDFLCFRLLLHAGSEQ